MIKLHGGLRPTPSGACMLCGTYEGVYFTAKIGHVPSFNGINGGQISSLEICHGDAWDGEKRVFAYNAGLTLADINMSTVLNIVRAIEYKFGLKRTQNNTCYPFAKITDNLKQAS